MNKDQLEEKINTFYEGIKSYHQLLSDSRDVMVRIVRNHDEIDILRSNLTRQYGALSKYIKKLGNYPMRSDVGGGPYPVYETALSSDILQRRGPCIDSVIQDLEYILGILENTSNDEIDELFRSKKKSASSPGIVAVSGGGGGGGGGHGGGRGGDGGSVYIVQNEKTTKSHKPSGGDDKYYLDTTASDKVKRSENLLQPEAPNFVRRLAWIHKLFKHLIGEKKASFDNIGKAVTILLLIIVIAFSAILGFKAYNLTLEINDSFQSTSTKQEHSGSGDNVAGDKVEGNKIINYGEGTTQSDEEANRKQLFEGDIYTLKSKTEDLVTTLEAQDFLKDYEGLEVENEGYITNISRSNFIGEELYYVTIQQTLESRSPYISCYFDDSWEQKFRTLEVPYQTNYKGTINVNSDFFTLGNCQLQ